VTTNGASAARRDLDASGAPLQVNTPTVFNAVYNFRLNWRGTFRTLEDQAEASLVKRVAAGEGVSYGHEWIAPHDTTVALIPAGYADGVWRRLGGRFDVWVRGARRPSIGRVCMDQLVIDLGENLDGVTEGDTAVLFGTGEGGQPHAQEWADLLETIHYEVVCAPRGRAVRRFRGGPQ